MQVIWGRAPEILNFETFESQSCWGPEQMPARYQPCKNIVDHVRHVIADVGLKC